MDCIGLLKGFFWSNGGDSVLAAIGTGASTGVKYASNGYPDVSANGAFSNAKNKKMEWGTISTIPEIPGIAVRYDGHIGYYIGNGEVIEARGFNYGVVRTKLAGRKWTHWFKIPNMTYSEKTTEPATPVQLGDRTLKKGMKGEDVATLQNTFVYILHYNLGSYGEKKDGVDGDYGNKTVEAVKYFQNEKKLSVDGVYGAKTHKALMATIADVAPDPTPEKDEEAIVKHLIVNASTLNLRAGDGTTYSILTTVRKGDKLVPVLDKKGKPIVSANGWNAVYRDTDVVWGSNKYLQEEQ